MCTCTHVLRPGDRLVTARAKGAHALAGGTHPRDALHHPARDRLRLRLQPGAVGTRRLARRCRTHARSRGRPGRDQHLRVVAGRTPSRRVRLGSSRCGDRAAALPRHPRQPRHRHVLPTALADRAAPRDPPHDGGRHDPLPRRPPGMVPQLARVPRARPGPGREGGRTVRQPPRGGALARVQRARLPQRAVLLRRVGRGLPALAAAQVRLDRGAQRGLGYQLLEPALQRLGRDPAAPADALARQPDPGDRLPPVQLRTAAGPLPPGGRHHPSVLRGADHDELHGHGAHPEPGLLVVGPRGGRRGERPLPRPPPRRPRHRALLRR